MRVALRVKVLTVLALPATIGGLFVFPVGYLGAAAGTMPLAYMVLMFTAAGVVAITLMEFKQVSAASLVAFILSYLAGVALAYGLLTLLVAKWNAEYKAMGSSIRQHL
jgi:hypothetical protein